MLLSWTFTILLLPRRLRRLCYTYSPARLSGFGHWPCRSCSTTGAGKHNPQGHTWLMIWCKLKRFPGTNCQKWNTSCTLKRFLRTKYHSMTVRCSLNVFSVPFAKNWTLSSDVHMDVENSPFPMSRGPVWSPKGMAIRGHVSGRGPALLGRMSDSEPFGDHTGPRRCLYMDVATSQGPYAQVPGNSLSVHDSYWGMFDFSDSLPLIRKI